MKKLKLAGIALVLAPTAGCITLGVLVGNKMLSNPEMLMLMKVLVYLFGALAIIGAVALMLMGIILVIGKGLGLSQGDTKAALGAAIALARSSNAVNKLYGRIPKGLPPPNYYQSPFEAMNMVNGEASNVPSGTERAEGEAWER